MQRKRFEPDRTQIHEDCDTRPRVGRFAGNEVGERALNP
jgi:hypothetical protein